MLNLPIIPRAVAALFSESVGRPNAADLPSILSSGAAIVIYIFIILTVIAFLVVALLFILPMGVTDIIGIVAGIVLIGFCFVTRKMGKKAEPAV